MTTEQIYRARTLRWNMTDAERTLWGHLRRRRLRNCKFRRQYPFGPYILDFVCLERKLVVELDGSQHDDQRTYDRIRDGWLSDQGFRILRFWNNEVLRQERAVLETIYYALEPYYPRCH